MIVKRFSLQRLAEFKIVVVVTELHTESTAQFTARYWLERDGRVPREEAARLIANLQWRGISGYPRTLDERGKR